MTAVSVNDRVVSVGVIGRIGSRWEPGKTISEPFPSSIGLYQKGQGYPKFDQAKADLYYKKVTDKVANLIIETVRKWDLAGL